MTTERVIEVPWALLQLPQSGLILDVGSCEATYQRIILNFGRDLHCLDPVDCTPDIPPGATFFNQSLIGNTLPRQHYDAVLILSVLEHIGLPAYNQTPFENGDVLALAETWDLLKPGCPAIITVPAGQSKVLSWYRQYSPAHLHRLFEGWQAEFFYWGYDGANYVPISEGEVERYDYRDRWDVNMGAGALAGIIAHKPSNSLEK